MIGRAFLKALDQLTDPAFRKVLLIGLVLASAVFAGLFFGLIWLMPEGVEVSDWDWVNDIINWMLGFAVFPVLLIVGWLLFPAVATMFMGIFLDDIIDAVEKKYYPDAMATRRPGIGETMLDAVRLSAMVLLLNFLALPLYLILAFTAIGPFILFLLLNAYLLGREYFELVAARHFIHADARKLRRARRDRTFFAGGAITLLFVIPVVNLLAPIIGAAMMVHVFHDAIATGEKV